MGIPDGAHTHGHGGSGPGGAIVLIIAVALPGPPVAAAAVLHVLVIVAGVIVGVGATSLVGLLVWRWRRLAAARVAPPLAERCTGSAEWRGPLRRSQRRGPRSSTVPRFTCTCTACLPKTWPPFCAPRTGPRGTL
jgi:hypothetical protein